MAHSLSIEELVRELRDAGFEDDGASRGAIAKALTDAGLATVPGLGTPLVDFLLLRVLPHLPARDPRATAKLLAKLSQAKTGGHRLSTQRMFAALRHVPTEASARDASPSVIVHMRAALDARALVESLRRAGHGSVLIVEPVEVLSYLAKSPSVSLLVTDLADPRSDSLLRRLSAAQPGLVVIAWCNGSRTDLVDDRSRLNPTRFVRRDTPPNEVCKLVLDQLARKSAAAR